MKFAINFLFLILTFCSLCFAGIDPSNKFRLGDGSNSDKTFEAQIGSGTANPKIKYSSSTAKWQIANDGTTFNDIPTNASSEPFSFQVNQLGLSSSVGSNALTVSVKKQDGTTDPDSGTPAKIAFRSSTATSGAFNVRSITSALSITVPSGATLGSSNGKKNWVYVYAIDNSGTVELAVSGNKIAGLGSLVSTTILDTSSDAAFTLYSAVARSNVPIVLIGRVESTQATAGTWASSPTEVSLLPFEQNAPRSELLFIDSTGKGAGSTDTKIAEFDATPIVDLGGPDISYTSNSTNGLVITILKNGVYQVHYQDQISPTGFFGISKNSASLTTSISSLSNAEILSIYAGGGTVHEQSDVTTYLAAGDVIRPHLDTGTSNGASATTKRFRIVKISN